MTNSDPCLAPCDIFFALGKRGIGEVEFAAADDNERATWLGWCAIAIVNKMGMYTHT